MVGAIACGGSATGPASATSPAINTGATPTPAAGPTTDAPLVAQPKLGTNVGETLPPFEFALFDGSVRSTAQLASQGRPVFLFFFATW